MPLCGENRMIDIYIYVKFVSDKHWKERYGAQEVDQTYFDNITLLSSDWEITSCPKGNYYIILFNSITRVTCRLWSFFKPTVAN